MNDLADANIASRAHSSRGGAQSIDVRTIEPELLLRWLVSDRRVLLVDVREPDEVEQSRRRLAGARNVPLHQLFVRRDELPLGKVDAVVTISNRGIRARAAAYTLSLLGFTDARALEGGLDAWERKGLRFE